MRGASNQTVVLRPLDLRFARNDGQGIASLVSACRLTRCLVPDFDGAFLPHEFEGSAMGQILHGCATTTEAVRREYKIKRYEINQKTVAKWKQRETVADLPTGPKEAKPSRLSFPSRKRRLSLLSGCLAGDALATGSPGRLSDTKRGDDMKFVSAAALALIGCLVGFNSANAQGAAMKTTPTTKILAIGTINPGFEQSQVSAVLPEEVRETVDLYLDGKIEQWYSLQGKPGVAFIINVTDPAVAHEMLEKLPLGKAHMMSFELIPIGPLNPLRFLQGMQPKP